MVGPSRAAMAINQGQFQKGLSMAEFFSTHGTEAACRHALERSRRPDGFVCPKCDHGACRRF